MLRVVNRGGVAAISLAVVVLGALVMGATAGAHTVWLCRPALTDDPCDAGLTTTVYTPRRTELRVVTPHGAAQPSIDCFYVYPTVSTQYGPLSNRRVQPAETGVARAQVARYSQYCNVYAPMYRQLTVPALSRLGIGGTARLQLGAPLRDVEHAFAVFLKRDSHGRGFVLIGHSQGAVLLRRMIATEIDPDRALRARLVSTILLGGNVLVTTGSTVGGDFQHIPACQSATQLHCVIAFSTFDAPPPPGTLLGFSGVAGESVLCTNPAALAGGSGVLDPIFPAAVGLTSAIAGPLGHALVAPPVEFSSYPGAYSAQCSSAGGFNVLQVTALGGAPTPRPYPSAVWGLHVLDANIAQGNLVAIIGQEAAAYMAAAR